VKKRSTTGPSATPRPPAGGFPEYRVRRALGPIAIDGQVTEPAWKEADTIWLVDNITGQKPRQATAVRLLWDDASLYLAYECEDTDAWSTYTQHDEPLYHEEVVEVFLDPSGLGRIYFELQVSPRNVSFDSLILNDGGRRGQGRGPNFQGVTMWTCRGLQHAVVVRGDPTRRGTQDEGWTVEMAIPFSQLLSAPHIPPVAGDTWRANIYRIDHARPSADGHPHSEFTSWSPTGMHDFHITEAFGRLVFEG
jgi:hypothetical protein